MTRAPRASQELAHDAVGEEPCALRDAQRVAVASETTGAHEPFDRALALARERDGARLAFGAREIDAFRESQAEHQAFSERRLRVDAFGVAHELGDFPERRGRARREVAL